MIATISSTGLVTFTDGDIKLDSAIYNKKYSYSDTGNSPNSAGAYSGTLFCQPNSSNEYVVGYNTSAGSTLQYLVGIDLWKMSPNGLLSEGVVSIPQILYTDMYIRANDNDFYYVYANVDDDKNVDVRVKIDGTTLAVSKIEETYHITPISTYTVNSSAYTYTLSETNGLQRNGITKGQLNTNKTTEKISNYFIGASNLGGSIPEGDFVAYSDNGRYYGIGKSGEQIAIGSNGGAAILKTKVSVPSTINIDNVAAWYDGIHETESDYSYLFVTRSTYGTPVTGSVFRIGKEE